MSSIPPYHQLFNPALKALRDLGGSGSRVEINEKVLTALNLPSEVSEKLHDPERGNSTELEYRLGWARTYLKKYGLIDNTSRGVWTLTSQADSVVEVDPRKVVTAVQQLSRRSPNPVPDSNSGSSKPPAVSLIDENADTEERGWRIALHKLLTSELSPAAFERLVQRVLRESGFIQVEVTGRAGDGGIDGKGIARIHGIMSFHVLFQCKRYQGVVGSSQIRDFRGAMVGRADKGLFITTGSFSRDAIKEATRDGASPIDLIDGDQLADKLLELRLGVNVEMVERVSVDRDWFLKI